MKTLLYVLTIFGLTIGTKLIEIAYNFGLRSLIRRTNFYKISKANITTVFTNKSKNEIDNAYLDCKNLKKTIKKNYDEKIVINSYLRIIKQLYET